jgi:16S rRNA (guanine527-N7)-methyltransferase
MYGMADSPNDRKQTEIESSLKSYEMLVRKYAGTLDLSSPKVLNQFEVAVRNTEIYEMFLEVGIDILDIGSGVGLPGIPIAVRRPDLRVTLCEIRKRRAAFLERAVAVLMLGNVSVYNGDVKQIQGQRYDVILAQAVGRLKDIYLMSQHILKPKWIILTRKGLMLDVEIEELRKTVGILTLLTRTLDDGTTLVAVYGETI